MTILSQSSDFDEDPPAGWGWRARRAYEEFDARRRDGSLAPPIVSWRAIRAAETSGAVLAAVVAEAACATGTDASRPAWPSSSLNGSLRSATT